MPRRYPKPRPAFYDALEYTADEKSKKPKILPQDATGKTGKRERYTVDDALATRSVSNYELRKLGAWKPILNDSPKKNTSDEFSTAE